MIFGMVSPPQMEGFVVRMKVKTYRAKSMQAALDLVRQELGPDATVLHTRQIPTGMLPWLTGSKAVEVVASITVQVPRRMSDQGDLVVEKEQHVPRVVNATGSSVPAAETHDFRAQYRDDVKRQLDNLQSLVEQLCKRDDRPQRSKMSDSLFQLFTNLIEAEIDEGLARELVDRVQCESDEQELDDVLRLKERVCKFIEQDIRVTGPLQVETGKTRLVALVGPTGIGKTTTIAKLAANYRLRDKVQVGLVTVDTYRIAAVDQLRTYADIIDLPMEVVATPREMRDAMVRLKGLDLILMDTAGRSPQDDIKIQELKSILAEAQPDEVHLVLSSASGSAQLMKTIRRFAEVGTTALLLTKLDESTGLGNLLPLLRDGQRPLSYLTNGQNVPDDIEPANARRLARWILQVESSD